MKKRTNSTLPSVGRLLDVPHWEVSVFFPWVSVLNFKVIFFIIIKVAPHYWEFIYIEKDHEEENNDMDRQYNQILWQRMMDIDKEVRVHPSYDCKLTTPNISFVTGSIISIILLWLFILLTMTIYVTMTIYICINFVYLLLF